MLIRIQMKDYFSAFSHSLFNETKNKTLQKEKKIQKEPKTHVNFQQIQKERGKLKNL